MIETAISDCVAFVRLLIPERTVVYTYHVKLAWLRGSQRREYGEVAEVEGCLGGEVAQIKCTCGVLLPVNGFYGDLTLYDKSPRR
jgi:hypothetical protein